MNNAVGTAVPVLKVNHLTKRFASVVANRDISLEIGKQEILAICGENGAGKSTFCKMLTGIYQPSDGEIFINGEQANFQSPEAAFGAGVAMVYQERNLVDMLTGAQNICFGHEPKNGMFMSEKQMMESALKIRDQLNLKIPLDVPVSEMGAGAKQLLEIMRAFYLKPKLLILDEPTASLGEGEIEPFLEFVKSIKTAMDISIIFISHKIEEVFQISDRIAVFTDGECVLTSNTSDMTQDQCIAAMLRSDKVRKLDIQNRDVSQNEVVLSMTEAEYDGRKHELPLEIHRGEVVGMYGLVGSGRTESMEVVYGLRRAKKKFVFNGETITKNTPFEMIKHGMILTPELRANAIFREFSLVDNICELFYKTTLSSKVTGFINSKKTLEFAKKVLEKNNVKHSSYNQRIVELSGGNMQKVIIGRSIEVDGLSLLVLDEPTAGMDVGAKFDIYLQIRRLAEEENIAIIFISSELDELISVTDRMYVYASGSVVDMFGRNEYDKARIIETAVRGRKLCN